MISFALAVHNHQPVGNFDEVLESAYKQAYAPFIDILSQFPNIKLTLHYSGILWEWFIERHPEFIARIKELSDRGQIELMSGAFYEPILPVLPEADQIGQIKMMNDFLYGRFGVKPSGLWLAERVWEPHLVKTLAECGLEYIVVDDSHFQEVGLYNEQLFGYYLSEEDGKTLKIFPGNKHLRYLIPFHPPEEVIDYIHSIHQQGHSAILQMGDDGEKFGVWPGTYHSVYNERWLERFFNLLDQNKSWIKITTYGEYIKENKPLGNVYLPTASYSEMMEWALPTDIRIKFEEAKETSENNQSCAPCRQFIKGGFWRNFLIKYPESNQMHKKMLDLSARLQKLPPNDEKVKSAKNHLWQAQCNCGYWHGVFGGLYLPHLRKAIYEHLIKCGQLINEIIHKDEIWLDTEIKDLFLNGKDTVLINTPQMSLTFSPQEGGMLQGFDFIPAALNFENLLTRRKESYHRKIIELIKNSSGQSDGAQNIHHIQTLKEADLDKYLSYDKYQKLSLIDHFTESRISSNDFFTGNFKETGNFIEKPYDYSVQTQGLQTSLIMERLGDVSTGGKIYPVLVKKTVTVSSQTTGMDIQYEIANLSGEDVDLHYGCEFNIAPAYPDGSYWKSEKNQGSLYENSDEECLNKLQLIIEYIKVHLSFEFDKSAGFSTFPLQTVSQAESGYEKIYQGQSLLFQWNFNLKSNDVWRVRIKNLIY